MTAKRCAVHPEAEAAAVCPGCGRPVCTECLEPGGESSRCLDCAIQGAAEASAAAAAAPRAAPGPVPRRRSGRLSAAVGVLAVAVLLAGALLLVQRRTVAAWPDSVPPEAAAAGDLFLVEEVVVGLLEEGGVVPDPERLAEELPPDLASEVRAGALRVEPVEGGFAIRWRTPSGGELRLVSRGGETEVVEGGRR